MLDMATNKASMESIFCPCRRLTGSMRHRVPNNAPMRKPSMIILVGVSLFLFIIITGRHHCMIWQKSLLPVL